MDKKTPKLHFLRCILPISQGTTMPHDAFNNFVTRVSFYQLAATSFPKVAPEMLPKYPKEKEKQKMMWGRKGNLVRRRKCEARQSIFTLRRRMCVCVCVCTRASTGAPAECQPRSRARASKVAVCEELLIVFWLREEVMIRLGYSARRPGGAAAVC